MLLVVSHHWAHVSPPLILFAFYWCSLLWMCMRIKGSRKQHNEKEEGRSAGKEERKGEKDAGGRRVAINPNSNDVRRGARGRLASNDCAWSNDAFRRRDESVGQLRSSNADWSTAARRRKQEESVIVPSWERHTHHTADDSVHFQSEQSLLLSAAAECEVEPFPAQQGQNCKQALQLVFRWNTHARGRLSVGRVHRCLWNATESSQDARIQVPGNQVGCDVDQRMSPEVEPERDEVVGCERATAVCPCPAAHPPSSRWPCRSYRSSRSWCRLPDAGPGSEVRSFSSRHGRCLCSMIEFKHVKGKFSGRGGASVFFKCWLLQRE